MSAWSAYWTCRSLPRISRICSRHLAKKLTLGGGIFLGYHRDGERKRIFQPQAYSLQNVLEVERKSRQSFSLVWSFVSKTMEIIVVLFRTLQMMVLISPLVVTGPIAIKNENFRQKYWFRLLVYTIERCGPVYVKLGQWAATRRDLFPAAMCEQLSKLQRHAQVHNWNHTETVLEKVLGSKVNEVFLSFDKEPIGSGCCAQVYKATIDETKLTNTPESSKSLPVAVKVLHPYIRDQFQRDLGVLRTLAGLLSTLFPSLRWLSLLDSLEEFAYSMRVQLDLTTEAENMLQFRRDFQSDDSIVFPRPILQLCYPDVIVQTFEDGIHVGQLLSQLGQVQESKKRELAEKGVDLLLKMVFHNNYVHADLHPGNILVRGLEPGKQIQLVVLDSGIIATLSRQDFRNFFDTFTAIVKGDGHQVGRLFLEHSVNECQDPNSFIEAMESLVFDLRSHQLQLSTVDVGDLLLRVFRTLRDHRVKLDANFASVILAIMILEGLGRSLDPNMDLVWKATPYIMESRLKELYFRS